MRLWDIYHPGIPDFLAEAALSPAMQRLTDIGMNCGCEYTRFPRFVNIDRYSRYDHSMGAALIVWHFTHDSAQAMAALLHDIATPAFAHVVDFLHGDHLAQETTEVGTADFIHASTDLMRICEKYGLPLSAVTNYHQYPIADNDLPQLSADRLEYTLSNSVNFGVATRAQAAAIYADLVASCNEFGEAELSFCHADLAHAFAAAALECSEIYVSPADRYAMQRLAELLKLAIASDILSEADLYLQEAVIIDKLTASPLSSQWEQFCRCSEVLCRNEPGHDGVWLRVPAKKRTIDPYIIDVGRVSEVFPTFGQKLRAFHAARQDAWLSAR